MSEKFDPVVTDRSVLTRWGGHEVLLARGFVPVARTFLWNAAKFEPKGLSPVEAMFVIHLMSYKWDEAAPYPGLMRIAANMGISVAYAKKIASDLEERGFLRKTRRRERGVQAGFATNEYDLQPLFDRLADYVRRSRVRLDKK